MSDTAKLDAAYKTLKTGTLWSSTGRCKGFATADPGEAAQIDAYVAALVAGGHPNMPLLATATGRGIAGIIDAGFGGIIPPPPDPSLRRIPVPIYSGAATVVTTLANAKAALTSKLGGELVVRGVPIPINAIPLNRNGQGLKTWFENSPWVGGIAGSTPYYGCWIESGCSFMELYGLDVTNAAGTGLGITGGAHDLTIVGKVHKVGAQGFFVPANYNQDVWNLNVDIDTSDAGNDLSQDPHAEKGTGLHVAYVGSSATANVVRDSKFTIIGHDGKTGSIQVGQSIHNCEFWIDARRLTFQAQSQVAGSAWQGFGSNVKDIIVRYLYAEDCVGRVVEADVLGSGPVTVEYARAHHCATNPKVNGEYWDQNPNVTYEDVAVLP